MMTESTTPKIGETGPLGGIVVEIDEEGRVIELVDGKSFRTRTKVGGAWERDQYESANTLAGLRKKLAAKMNPTRVISASSSGVVRGPGVKEIVRVEKLGKYGDIRYHTADGDTFKGWDSKVYKYDEEKFAELKRLHSEYLGLRNEWDRVVESMEPFAP